MSPSLDEIKERYNLSEQTIAEVERILEDPEKAKLLEEFLDKEQQFRKEVDQLLERITRAEVNHGSLDEFAFNAMSAVTRTAKNSSNEAD